MLRLSPLFLAGGWSTEDPRHWLFILLFFAMLLSPRLLGARINRREPAALIPFLVTLVVWLVVPLRAQGTGILYLRFVLFALPSYALLFRPGEPIRGGMRLMWLPLVCWAFLAVHADRLLTFARESAPF